MGLLKGVIEGGLETAYRSLKYNNDSNQPYIVVPIPDYTDESGTNFALRAPDFILRQGALDLTSANIASSRTGINVGVDATFAQLGLFGANPNIALRIQSNPFDLDVPVPTDALRVGRFLFDTKNIAGVLFSTKQILLEKTRTNAPGGGRRVYVPYSTVLQSAVGQFGIHLDKTGLNPLDFDRRGYGRVTLENESDFGNSGNRLVLIYKSKQIGINSLTAEELLYAESEYDIDTQNEQYLYSYRGGPNTLGFIGKTRVRIDGTGYGSPRDRTNNYDPANLRPQDNDTYVFSTSILDKYINPSPGVAGLLTFIDSFSTEPKDFRKAINEFIDPDFANTGKQVLPYTDYTAFNRNKTYLEYTPVTDPDPLNPISSSLAYDGINALKVLRKRFGFNAKAPATTGELQAIKDEEEIIDKALNQDLIPFYFQIINNNSTQDTDADWFLFFRAYLNNMSDNFKADWNSYKYIGRAENFYKYSGFSRDISLSFSVYAHSYKEMAPIYEKLNYLVGVTAPSYSQYGYMRGNFINLRVGDYLNNVPGIITNIGLKPSFEGGWEIGRDALGTIDPNTKKLPKLIEVDLSFTPIHNFTPISNREGYIG
jgi:hypothetical protein